MPNWCDTTYHVVGDRQELNALYEMMTKLYNMEKPLVENGFGTDWLGCLVEALGEDWNKVYCRGTFYDVDLSEDELRFVTDTAWSPCDEVISLLKEKYPTLDFYYYAEEPGCGIFQTNDADGSFFSDRYIVSINNEDSDFEYEYFETIEDACEWISEISGKTITNMEEIKSYNEWLMEQSDDYYCYINEIEIVD